MSEVNKFKELAAIDVSSKIEKKNGMSYLSWSWAVSEMMKADPQASWQFLDPITYPDKTMMVHCNVTMFGKTLYMFLPVMDHKNKAIVNPDAVAINKAMMRCLVKGIAVHGLGLYIYAGEDLPEDGAHYMPAQQMQQVRPTPQQGPRKLNDDELTRAIGAIQSGKVTKDQLLNPAQYALTDAQRALVAPL